MPVSHHEGKDWLARQYRSLQPARVVDVGAGEGIYAMRFRPTHQGYWTAIEAWEPYVDRFDLRSKYDDVILGDVRSIDLPAADLYIAGDVLEHMPKQDALDLIDRMQQAAPHLFVSIPIIEIPQGHVNGNPYEEHHHHWTIAEMGDAIGPCLGRMGTVIGTYAWTRPEASHAQST